MVISQQNNVRLNPSKCIMEIRMNGCCLIVLLLVSYSSLSVSQCDEEMVYSDWITITDNQYKLFSNDSSSDYWTARQICQSHNAELAEITSENIDQHLSQIMSCSGFQQAYIGLHTDSDGLKWLKSGLSVFEYDYNNLDIYDIEMFNCGGFKSEITGSEGWHCHDNNEGYTAVLPFICELCASSGCGETITNIKDTTTEQSASTTHLISGQSETRSDTFRSTSEVNTPTEQELNQTFSSKTATTRPGLLSSIITSQSTANQVTTKSSKSEQFLTTIEYMTSSPTSDLISQTISLSQPTDETISTSTSGYKTSTGDDVFSTTVKYDSTTTSKWKTTRELNTNPLLTTTMKTTEIESIPSTTQISSQSTGISGVATATSMRESVITTPQSSQSTPESTGRSTTESTAWSTTLVTSGTVTTTDSSLSTSDLAPRQPSIPSSTQAATAKVMTRTTQPQRSTTAQSPMDGTKHMALTKRHSSSTTDSIATRDHTMGFSPATNKLNTLSPRNSAGTPLSATTAAQTSLTQLETSPQGSKIGSTSNPSSSEPLTIGLATLLPVLTIGGIAAALIGRVFRSRKKVREGGESREELDDEGEDNDVEQIVISQPPSDSTYMYINN